MSAEKTLNAETQTETADAGVLGKLGITLNSFIGQLFDFTLVLVVMWLFVFRPLMKKMDERAKKISDGLAFAKNADFKLSEASAEKDRIVREAKAEAHALMEQASVKAEAIRQDKLAQAKAEIEKVISEAKEQIKNERTSSFTALKQDVAELVALATEKVSGQKLDEKGQKALIQSAIKEVENS